MGSQTWLFDGRLAGRPITDGALLIAWRGSTFTSRKHGPQHCSSSPPNCPLRSWHAYSASTSKAQSDGNEPVPETGPPTQPTSAADADLETPRST
jgi:hypothetical protein